MNFINLALNFLFPPVCGICGKKDMHYLCDNCYKILQRNMLNLNTSVTEKPYEELFCLFRYDGIIRNKIISYKFRDNAYLSDTFCKIFIKNLKSCDFIKKYDIIIPVPIHKKRKKQRGYNQCELIAKKLAESLEKCMYTDVLIKQKNTIPQSTLGKEERIKNVQNVYKMQNKEKILNKKVLLLDDIYTTGSTVFECSRILKQSGALKVGVLTIAKD